MFLSLRRSTAETHWSISKNIGKKCCLREGFLGSDNAGAKGQIFGAQFGVAEFPPEWIWPAMGQLGPERGRKLRVYAEIPEGQREGAVFRVLSENPLKEVQVRFIMPIWLCC